MSEFTKAEIIEILKDDTKNDWLFSLADEVRKKYVGDEIHLRALIEYSNICKNDCKYCGLRCENRHVERYRLSPEEIISQAYKAVEYGFKTIVLQGGEDAYFSKDIMCEIITEIKRLNVALTLSLGERSYGDLKAFRQCGADRYLIRIETTDRVLYEKMHPYMDFDNRLRCLKDLKSLGYEVGTGCLVGLPDQTIESLADDILFFKDIDADMIGIGPLIVHSQTPLKDCQNGSLKLALKVLALTRILLKDINIPATTAMETLDKNGRILALQCGANVVMPNVSDEIHRGKYEIYPNKGKNSLPLIGENSLESKLLSIGRTIATGYGFRNKEKENNDFR